MKHPVHTIVMEDEFKHCPLCNYKDGFHTMLQRDGDDILWLFICPACHEVFDIGQTANN